MADHKAPVAKPTTSNTDDPPQPVQIRVTMASLLAKFDPEQHRRGLAFEPDAAGSQTR